MMYPAGIIFEGGGMRGGYTCGVIDALLENDMEFQNCYGVSSGACHATSYISKQKGRAQRVNVNYIHDKRYRSLKNLFTTGNYFGTKMIFDTIPRELDPFDFETYDSYGGTFYAVVINCRTAEPEYLPVRVMEDEWQKILASFSLPLLSKMTKINGVRYLDGGIVDSIPIKRSIADGNKKTVIVLTQDKNYRKKLNKAILPIAVRYCFYPKFIYKIAVRHKRYNETLKFIDEEEAAGNVFVIRPKKKVKIGRLEFSREKMDKLYDDGYKDAEELMPKLKEFLEG